MMFSVMILILLCIDLQELFLFLISSPFLLSGTLKFYQNTFQRFMSFIIEKLLRDLYVDDLVSGFNDENLVYKFYQGACNILIQGGFQLRKWITNFKSLTKTYK